MKADILDWEAAYLVSPHGPFINDTLSKNAVILTNDDRRWLIPRQVLPVDSPLLADLYEEGIPLSQKLRILALLGVSHILTTGESGHPKPVHTDWLAGSPEWDFQGEAAGGNEELFVSIYTGMPVPHSEDPVGFTPRETHLFQINYPHELQLLYDEDRPGPWLYDFATNSHMEGAK